MHKAAATILGCGDGGLSLVMMLCHVDFSLELSTWSYGDTTVAGAAWLSCSDVWTLAFAGHFTPRAKAQISHWIYPAAMGRAMLLAELPSKALPQGPWPRGLFATSSDYRNFRLLVHYKTNRHSLHLVFLRRLDMAWGMQMPCDEEKKIPGLWRSKSWQISRHDGIILDLFANWGTAVKHVSILGAEE